MFPLLGLLGLIKPHQLMPCSTLHFDFPAHELKPGTNIGKGLRSVYEMMIAQEEEEVRRGLNPPPVSTTTRHIIILLTDGNYNLGGSPSLIIQQIKKFLKIGSSSPNPRDDHLGKMTIHEPDGFISPLLHLSRLDVYAFGNGPDVDVENINELASHKPNERHGFILKDLSELQEVLEESLGEEPRQEICKGVIVSDQYILTAAHCLAGIKDISVILGTTNFAVAEIQYHPEYNSEKIKNKDSPEFYNYDVALVKLKEKHLPSFTSSSNGSCCATTQTYFQTSLPQPASFKICCHYNYQSFPATMVAQKMACNLDAAKAKGYVNVANISEMVNEHFLCTGGIDPQVDPNVCSYDSGGPLLIQRRLRYVQVSGNLSQIQPNRPTFQPSNITGSLFPTHVRDFHINIFKILPWLKEQLGTEVEFL
ncbi:PREDICTED: complement factor B-like [Thamnophis sirtalis]|uniref:Complement factor B-like n=1 Tax=Thamnophis sirtalis TaxID=35019 RepID=A0A6I9XZE8_9SAUR|nr:PREDICTED: complement factor B-like [Thamnophis sirtalis]